MAPLSANADRVDSRFIDNTIFFLSVINYFNAIKRVIAGSLVNVGSKVVVGPKKCSGDQTRCQDAPCSK